jgi:hypothetical protein
MVSECQPIRPELQEWLDRLADARRAEQQEFCKHLDWESVVADWRSRAAQAAVRLDPFFESIRIFHPGHPDGRPSIATWWRSQSLQKRAANLQRYLARSCIPELSSSERLENPLRDDERPSRKGEMQTLGFLWLCRESPEKLAAVLILASLFSRKESVRTWYPELWPPRHCLDPLQLRCRQAMSDVREFWQWENLCTQVIPYVSSDHERRIESMDALLQYLFEEHMTLLQQYRPVVIEFVPRAHPDLDRDLLARIAHEIDEDRAEAVERREQERRATEAHNAVVRAAEAELERWRQLSTEELLRLVWSKPMRDVAAEFGVKDAAVAKRCKETGVSKPPAGFWTKVNLGQIPHPQGVPTRASNRFRSSGWCHG